MKNTVVKKFISNKIERNISKYSLIGDIINQIDVLIQIAETNKNIRQGTSKFMLSELEKLKADFVKLCSNKKYLHLKAFHIYRLVKLKYKLENIEVFDI